MLLNSWYSDIGQKQGFLGLRVDAVDRAKPYPIHRLAIRKVKRRGFLVVWVLVYRANYDGKLCVVENRSLLIKEIINTELYPPLDDPPERAVVMIRDIVYQERVIGPRQK